MNASGYSLMAGSDQKIVEGQISSLKIHLAEGRILVSQSAQTNLASELATQGKANSSTSRASRSGVQPKIDSGTKVFSHTTILYWLQRGGPRKVRKHKRAVWHSHLVTSI